MTFLLQQICIYTPLALGAYLSISLMRIPNLAIESAFALGAIIGTLAAGLMTSGYSMFAVAIGAAFLAGSLTGISAALLHVRGYISHLLAGLITIGLVHGVLQHCAPTGQLLMPKFSPLSEYSLELGMLVVVGICISGLLELLNRQLGFACAVYGNNPNFLRHYKLHSSWVITWGLGLANGLSGISGFLVAQRNGFADSTMGSGIILLVLTMLILARTASRYTRILNPLVPLLGVGFYFVLQLALLKMGFDLRYFTAMQAVIIGLLLIASNKIAGKQEPDTELGV